MKWTKEVLRQVEELSIQGKSNKEIAEIIGSKTDRVSDVRSRYGLTNAKLKRATGSNELGECFADTNGVTCHILKKRRCKDCNFFKTYEQVKQGNAKALKRIMSLDLRIRNNIEMLYGLEALK